MDGGAWWAAVHGVAKSRTRLSDFTFTFHFWCIGEGNGNPLQCSLPGESQGWESLVGCHLWRESLPVLPRLMSWLSGSCFPGTVLLLPGHSSWGGLGGQSPWELLDSLGPGTFQLLPGQWTCGSLFFLNLLLRCVCLSPHYQLFSFKMLSPPHPVLCGPPGGRPGAESSKNVSCSSTLSMFVIGRDSTNTYSSQQPHESK